MSKIKTRFSFVAFLLVFAVVCTFGVIVNANKPITAFAGINNGSGTLADPYHDKVFYSQISNCKTTPVYVKAGSHIIRKSTDPDISLDYYSTEQTIPCATNAIWAEDEPLDYFVLGEIFDKAENDDEWNAIKEAKVWKFYSNNRYEEDWYVLKAVPVYFGTGSLEDPYYGTLDISIFKDCQPATPKYVKAGSVIPRSGNIGLQFFETYNDILTSTSNACSQYNSFGDNTPQIEFTANVPYVDSNEEKAAKWEKIKNTPVWEVVAYRQISFPINAILLDVIPGQPFFNSNGGSTVTLTNGVPSTPTKNGFVFLGWYTDATAGDKVESGYNNGQTYYAHWVAVPAFKGENGEEITVVDGVPTVPTKDGFKFLGWFTSPEGGEKVESNFENGKTYYARFEEIKKSKSAGSTVGIVLVSILLLLIIVYVLGYFFLYRKGKLDNSPIKVIYAFLPRNN